MPFSAPARCNNCDCEYVKTSGRQIFCSATCRHSNAHKLRKDYKAQWNKENAERVSEYKKKYAENNRELRVQQTERYRKANPEYYREYASLYSRKKQHAKIKSLTELDELVIAEMYDLARRTGMEVDHIVPLTNKLVSGLHCPWNLQLLTREQNARKNNKFCQENGLKHV